MRRDFTAMRAHGACAIHVSLGALVALSMLASCKPRETRPGGAPSDAAAPRDADPVAADEAAIRATLEEAERRRRSKEATLERCEVAPLMKQLLGDIAFTACGELGMDPEKNEAPASEATRACILRAVREKRAFSAKWFMQGTDSYVEDGAAGRPTDGGYELRWYQYDSSVSGQLAGDPSTTTWRCHDVLDAKKAKVDETSLGLACTERKLLTRCP